MFITVQANPFLRINYFIYERKSENEVPFPCVLPEIKHETSNSAQKGPGPTDQGCS